MTDKVQVEIKGDRDGMAAVITDEMLDTYAVTSTWDGLASALVTRYDGLADRVFCYGSAQEWISSPELTERWRSVAADFTAR